MADINDNYEIIERPFQLIKCIICCKNKKETEFDKIGEHIVPQSLGNKNFVTYRVCHDCNEGLGRTVDYSLRNYYPVSQACFDRSVPGTKKSVFDSRMGKPDSLVNKEELEFQGLKSFGVGENEVYLIPPGSATEKRIGKDAFLFAYTDIHDRQNYAIFRLSDWGFEDNPDVPGAILKIAYEASHLFFGDEWLDDITAVSMRNVLYSYAENNVEKARYFLNHSGIYAIPPAELYANMNADRDTFIREAITNRTCINSLWIAPYKHGLSIITAVLFDIQGLSTGYVLVRHSQSRIREPILLAPPI